MRKICKNCDLEKDETEFFVSLKTGRLEDACKSCKRDLKNSEMRKVREIPERVHLREQLES